MGPVRRVVEWLRDLDARYGYVKRARVAPGEPAPVRLRKIADADEVVLVNPSGPARPGYAPVARADVPVRPLPPPLPSVVASAPGDDTGEIPVMAAPSEEYVEEELEQLESADEPADPPRGPRETEPEHDEHDDGEHDDGEHDDGEHDAGEHDAGEHEDADEPEAEVEAGSGDRSEDTEDESADDEEVTAEEEYAEDVYATEVSAAEVAATVAHDVVPAAPYVPPPAAADPDRVSRLRSHRPD